MSRGPAVAKRRDDGAEAVVSIAPGAPWLSLGTVMRRSHLCPLPHPRVFTFRALLSLRQTFLQLVKCILGQPLCLLQPWKALVNEFGPIF